MRWGRTRVDSTPPSGTKRKLGPSVRGRAFVVGPSVREGSASGRPSCNCGLGARAGIVAFAALLVPRQSFRSAEIERDSYSYLLAYATRLAIPNDRNPCKDRNNDKQTQSNLSRHRPNNKLYNVFEYTAPFCIKRFMVWSRSDSLFRVGWSAILPIMSRHVTLPSYASMIRNSRLPAVIFTFL